MMNAAENESDEPTPTTHPRPDSCLPFREAATNPKLGGILSGVARGPWTSTTLGGN